LKYLDQDHEIPSVLTKAANQTPGVIPSVREVDDILVERPERTALSANQSTGQRKIRSEMDYSAMEAANRKLGYQGEEFVFGFERARLTKAGCSDLAHKVEWVSKTKGDGLGYDIHSFDETGHELFIEVKTTNRGRHFPFVITLNEAVVSQHLSNSYRIYRVFDFSTEPRLFILEGPVEESCELRPLTYEARPYPP